MEQKWFHGTSYRSMEQTCVPWNKKKFHGTKKVPWNKTGSMEQIFSEPYLTNRNVHCQIIKILHITGHKGENRQTSMSIYQQCVPWNMEYSMKFHGIPWNSME